MRRVIKFWHIVLLDTLAVIFIIGSIATGWLPGPGGIPLFLIGLGLLSLNHAWAERYMEFTRRSAGQVSDMVFTPRLQLFYDVSAPLLILAGGWLLLRHSAPWLVSLGVSTTFLGIVILLGNRGRWDGLKQRLKHKR